MPSHLYSLSFAPNPGWSRSFSAQPEIWSYLQRTAEESGVLPHFRFDCEVTDARWDDEDRVWVLQTPQGEFRARVLIAGIGGLIEPRTPDVPGLAGFEGEVFHSARWNHDYDLAGKRVAVIGTGASSIQFVPKIQPQVAELHLFQRTPAWIAPRGDHPISATRKRLFKRFPALQRLNRSLLFWAREMLALGFTKHPRLMRLPQRVAERHLRSQVEDPELRRKLTPDYTLGCKRALISNDFYPAVAEPNVELLTEGLAEVRGNTVIGSDGTEREVDAIILGTGFDVTGFPGAAIIHGRDGRSLTELWDGSPRAHRCTTVNGFPNFFMLGGPNFGTGHMSAVEMVENQYSYVLDALAKIDRQGIASVEVRREVQDRFVAEIDRKMKRTVWMHRRLPELVHRPDRPQLDPVARLDVRAREGDEAFRRRRVRGRARRRSGPGADARLTQGARTALGEGFRGLTAGRRFSCGRACNSRGMAEATEGGSATGDAPRASTGPFAVGRYAAALRDFMRERARVQVIGEVTSLRLTAKSAYFELRDADGALPCSMWRNDWDALKLPDGAIREGSEVVVFGGPDYYPGSTTASPSFSFRCKRLRLAGEGDLLAQLAVLRRKLHDEGLFEPQRLLPRSTLPKVIGIVTGRGSPPRPTSSPACGGAAGRAGRSSPTRRSRIGMPPRRSAGRSPTSRRSTRSR